MFILTIFGESISLGIRRSVVFDFSFTVYQHSNAKSNISTYIQLITLFFLSIEARNAYKSELQIQMLRSYNENYGKRHSFYEATVIKQLMNDNYQAV